MSEWPTGQEIAALGENHRRAVAGTLRTLEQRLRELTAKELAELPQEELGALHGALAATGWPEPPLNAFPDAGAGWLESSHDRRTADDRFSDGADDQ